MARRLVVLATLLLVACGASPAAPERPITTTPQVFTGTGPTVLDVTFAERTTLHLTHKGQRAFVVTASPDQGSPSQVVNATGAYSGTRLLAAGHYRIQVDADGAWSATAAPLGRDDSAAGTITGTGDDIRGAFLATDPRVQYHVTYSGTRPFTVALDCTTGGRDVLVQVAGPYDGALPAHLAGVCVWDIAADGKWTIAPK